MGATLRLPPKYGYGDRRTASLIRRASGSSPHCGLGPTNSRHGSRWPPESLSGRASGTPRMPTACAPEEASRSAPPSHLRPSRPSSTSHPAPARAPKDVKRQRRVESRVPSPMHETRHDEREQAAHADGLEHSNHESVLSTFTS